MAVTENKNESILRLKFENGQTTGGEIKYKSKNIRHLKPEATMNDVYAVGKAMSDLLAKPADVITKVDETDYLEAA